MKLLVILFLLKLHARINILERLLFEQMSVYFDKFLSDQQCGF